MNLLETVFEWVVSTTIRASLVALAILAIQMLLRPWLPAKWRHPLWLPLLLVMVLPFVPSLPVHLIPARPAAVALSGESFASTAGIADAATTSAVVHVPPERVPLLPALWLAGVLVSLTVGVTGYHLKLKAIRAQAVSPSPALQAKIEEARTVAGLSKTPLVWLSREVESPAVSGLWRPVLLLPETFPTTFTTAESRLILLHEFSHIKRHDLAQNWLLFTLQALHWFNPVIWFAFARVRLDRETACDARVLALDTQDRRAEYGGALLKMQEMPAVGGLRLGFLGIFENVSGLRSRITDISRHRRSHPAWRAGGVAMIGMLTLFGATKAEEPKARKFPAVPLAAPGEPPVASGTDAVIGKLKTIVIPVVKFENTSLEEAADFLRLRSKELDAAEKDPAKKGVNCMIRKPRDGERGQDTSKLRVNLNLKNATMITVLTEISKQTKLMFSMDESGVTFVPAGLETKFQNMPLPADPEPIKGKAAQAGYKIIIPAVDFAHVPLAEAVDTLNRQAKKNSKGQPVFPVVLGPGVEGSLQIEELSLRNVPFTIAVEYLCRVSKNVVVADDREIRITKP